MEILSFPKHGTAFLTFSLALAAVAVWGGEPNLGSNFGAANQISGATDGHQPGTDGHQPVQPLPEPPAKGLRPVGCGDHESVGTIQIDQTMVCEVTYEFMVGGDKFRADPGETLVAYSLPGTKSYSLLGAGHAESLIITEQFIEQSRNSVEQIAKVLFNRVWKRLVGQGIIEPVNDWEGSTPSHPEFIWIP